MRLWTIQDSNWFKTWFNRDKLYKDKSPNIRFVDERFIQEGVSIDGFKHPLDIFPIYCFASPYVSSSLTFSIRSLISDMNYYSHYFSYNLQKCVLIELEVNKNKILSMKDINKDYQGYSKDMPEDVSKYAKIMYRETRNEDAIIYSDFLNVRRNNPIVCYEALLQCIDKSDIVCYREFEYISDSKELQSLLPNWVGGDSYTEEGFFRITTTVVNRDKFPTFEGTICAGTDGYPRIKIRNDYYVADLSSIDTLQKLCGMNGCPRYYTLKEAGRVCDNMTVGRIIAEPSFERFSSDITIMDMFPNGLCPSDKTVLSEEELGTLVLKYESKYKEYYNCC